MHYSAEMLIKRQQVVDVVNQLFIQTDNRNWPMVEKCFTDQVAFDMTSLSGGEPENLTPQEITARWDEGLRDIAALHHQVGNFVVDVHGDDNAHVFCYGTAWHFKPLDSGRNTRIFCRLLRVRPGAWRRRHVANFLFLVRLQIRGRQRGFKVGNTFTKLSKV